MPKAFNGEALLRLLLLLLAGNAWRATLAAGRRRIVDIPQYISRARIFMGASSFGRLFPPSATATATSASTRTAQQGHFAAGRVAARSTLANDVFFFPPANQSLAKTFRRLLSMLEISIPPSPSPSVVKATTSETREPFGRATATWGLTLTPLSDVLSLRSLRATALGHCERRLTNEASARAEAKRTFPTEYASSTTIKSPRWKMAVIRKIPDEQGHGSSSSFLPRSLASQDRSKRALRRAKGSLESSETKK